MADYKMTIGGELVDSNQTLDVINPATEQVFATCPEATKEQLDAAVEAAQTAFPDWSRRPIDERKDLVRQLAAKVAEHRDELIGLLVKEQGKPISNATKEVEFTSYFAMTTAGLNLAPEVLRDDDQMKVEAHYKPLGVVGAIAPWNYPLLLAYWKVFAALVAGNCVVLKPSPYTPVTTLKAAQLFNDMLPPGVLNVVSGGDELGRWIVEHPGIAKISFTGSSATGKKIAAAAAGTLKRVTLELGGNDAAVVLDDADPEEIAEKIFWTAFNNSGQICMAIKRLYVQEAVYDRMCDALTKLAEGVTVGDGGDETSMLGPVQNQMQFDRVCGILEDTKQRGRRFLTGGEVPEQPGYFVPVTLVAEAEEGDRLVDEEPFGPVLPIIKFNDVDEVITRANASEYGLGGSVWTNNIERGQELAAKMDSGTVWVNQHSVVLPDIPFGGAKNSGLGCEGADEGLKNFCQLQVVNVAK